MCPDSCKPSPRPFTHRASRQAVCAWIERVAKQPDHVRIYGCDFGDRLAAAGFLVHRFKIAKHLGDGAERYGLHKSEGVTVCTLPRKPGRGRLVPGCYFDRITGFHTWKNRGG